MKADPLHGKKDPSVLYYAAHETDLYTEGSDPLI
jgi:hypothetical protein